MRYLLCVFRPVRIKVRVSFIPLVVSASVLVLAFSGPAREAGAETVTHFGDFADGFGPVPIPYSSADAYDPGSFVPLFHEGVASIPKFDPSIGTLTDITVFVSPTIGSSPIFYTLGGSLTVSKSVPSIPEYGGSMELVAELMLNYEGDTTSSTVFGETISLAGGDAGAPATLEFTTPVTPIGADGMLTGSSSVFGAVDMDDFVGAGFVDSLFVDLLIQDTADFGLENATATGSLAFDVFDADSGIDDAVIGVTYTYSITAVPEPSTIGFLAFGCGMLTLRRRRV